MTDPVAYSLLCHDIAPFADQAAPARLAGAITGFAGAYGRSPYLDVCQRWPVGHASAQLAETVRSDVPVLIAVGAFDPYVPQPLVREGLAGLTTPRSSLTPSAGTPSYREPRVPMTSEPTG